MELLIDTTNNQNISISLIKNGKVLVEHEFEAAFAQAEKLLPEIDGIIENNINIKDIKKISVANQGGSFTALRIGIVTANALAYSLSIPVVSLLGKSIRVDGIDMVKPEYSSEPNISIGKKILK